MLIFPNGKALLFPLTSEEYLDDNGNPISTQNIIGKECRCTINSLSENKKGRYEDGQYNNATYSVSFNMDDVGEKFVPQLVSLIHDYKGDIGSFQVQRVEHYPITRTIEIWV